ncbi:hypothetical protein [Roseixanthobacter pseudopolyaromaticivorans]|uniref:hypothetical protein n=1 Tax=Xanthobacteraceae TaxID=335928 RepID=UPI00372BE976
MAGKTKAVRPDKQALFMWALLARTGAAAFQRDVQPVPEKADRDALEKAGLIRCERRRGAIWVEVTEKGWGWASDNMGAALPDRSIAGTAILHAWLTKLQSFMAVRGFALANILDPQPAQAQHAPPSEPASGLEPSTGNLEARIRGIYLELTAGRFNTRALLKDVRAKMTDVDRDTLDKKLKQMQADRQAILYQLDNRMEVTDGDREAAIYFGGEPRHILWIER